MRNKLKTLTELTDNTDSFNSKFWENNAEYMRNVER